jgi:hypothetical protein
MLLIEGVVLGHHVSSEGIKFDPAKIEVIVRIPPPKTQKEARIFLGHAGYYQRFIEIFTKIATPMFGLLIKDVDFVWTEQCQTAFETLKAKLSMAPVLRGSNWTLPFHISTDASNTAIGGVLGQKEDQQSYAIKIIIQSANYSWVGHDIFRTGPDLIIRRCV